MEKKGRMSKIARTFHVRFSKRVEGNVKAEDSQSGSGGTKRRRRRS